jgi:hypothetical protein
MLSTWPSRRWRPDHRILQARSTGGDGIPASLHDDRNHHHAVRGHVANRLEDAGLGSVRSTALWLSVGLQPAAARRQLFRQTRQNTGHSCCGHRITAALMFVAPAHNDVVSPAVNDRARATSWHVVLDDGGVDCEVPRPLARMPMPILVGWLHLFFEPPAY